MQKPLIFTATILTAFFLGGCANSTDSGSKLVSFPGAYKIDVQQGNVITQSMVNQLKLGMSKRQVQYVMGTSLLESSFDTNRWDYVYSNQPGGEPRTQKRVTVFFENNRLVEVKGDLTPEA